MYFFCGPNAVKDLRPLTDLLTIESYMRPMGKTPEVSVFVGEARYQAIKEVDPHSQPKPVLVCDQSDPDSNPNPRQMIWLRRWLVNGRVEEDSGRILCWVKGNRPSIWG